MKELYRPDGRLGKRKGSYVVLFAAEATQTVRVGALGEMVLRPGVYGYVGSAFGTGGVRARVGRHLRPGKKRHWHIDYVRPFLRPYAVWGSYDSQKREHLWAQIMMRFEGVAVPLVGFGASDCGCVSHFFWWNERPLWQTFVAQLPVDHAPVWAVAVRGERNDGAAL